MILTKMYGNGGTVMILTKMGYGYGYVSAMGVRLWLFFARSARFFGGIAMVMGTVIRRISTKKAPLQTNRGYWRGAFL